MPPFMIPGDACRKRSLSRSPVFVKPLCCLVSRAAQSADTGWIGQCAGEAPEAALPGEVMSNETDGRGQPGA